MDGWLVPRVDGTDPGGRAAMEAAGSSGAVAARAETPVPVLPAKTGTEAQNDPNKPSPEQIERAVVRMNIAAQMAMTHLKFELHDDPRRIVVKIIRDDTGEVIRQIPPEDLVKMDEQMRSVLGMFFDQKI